MIANRPRPAETAAYFTEFGITPKTSVYLARLPNGEYWGCAMGAILAHATGGPDAGLAIIDGAGDKWFATAQLSGLPFDYIFGIDEGFSMGYAVRRASDRTPEYDAGVEDGIAVRDLVFAGGKGGGR